jgi:hypothetical protein
MPETKFAHGRLPPKNDAFSDRRVVFVPNEKTIRKERGAERPEPVELE